MPHRLDSFNEATNAKTDFLNEHLRSLCDEDDGLLFLDANLPRTPAYYHSDGLHFNLNGSSFFGHYISKYLLPSSNFPKPQLWCKDVNFYLNDTFDERSCISSTCKHIFSETDIELDHNSSNTLTQATEPLYKFRKGTTLIHLNVRNLLPKLEELKFYLTY